MRPRDRVVLIRELPDGGIGHPPRPVGSMGVAVRRVAHLGQVEMVVAWLDDSLERRVPVSHLAVAEAAP